MAYLDFKKFSERYSDRYNINLAVKTKYFELVIADKKRPANPEDCKLHVKYLIQQSRDYGIKFAEITIGNYTEMYSDPWTIEDDAEIKIIGDEDLVRKLNRNADIAQ